VKVLFWVGMAVLILGIVSLVVPMPRNEQEGFKTGGRSVGAETQREKKASPFVSAIVILGGVSTMFAGKRKR